MTLPKPLDEAAAARALADLAEKSPDWALDAETREFLGSVFAASPYLRDLALRDPAFARRTLEEAPDALLDEVLAGLILDLEEPALRRRIRQTKAKAALLIAIADLSGRWGIEQVTEALTRLADSLLTACVNWLLLDTPKLVDLDPQNPAKDCGYTVLAMGKHGAYELNYSSDVDLIVLYDSTTPKLKPGAEPSDVFVRLTRRLVALMQEPDENGYGFRVDLRLRPDPRATQIAISMEAAGVYYESMGQNWERAAMIKARPAAGDLGLGEEFLSRLKPYVWRKYLDFAAIADVQSMKRQIHAVRGHGEIAVFGHNIKLGRGGIREIEFFVQTQQLIAGGRNLTLRGRRTLEMLDALAAAQWITPIAAAELKQDYRYLRTIEHRIQMVADEQTHT
ncbi:MAG: bifunctional [glutamine synthetase] adenylyltransferase/[glutamine synthetase]-adenylyl-L-tyrosine phosphorylase, partial [Aestuariivirgaceae bacterium]|nr:bifunctional [glutamine synthetase] adenylyltransferase/[glutamine synthetase]-adenylyl-L-tyrosine phosphorylase [Aestuariivirgaceae bacterium]